MGVSEVVQEMLHFETIKKIRKRYNAPLQNLKKRIMPPPPYRILLDPRETDILHG